MPDQNVASLRVMYGHHRRQDDLDHRLKALRDAGLPEWAFDFRGRPEDRLDAAAIRSLAMNGTWIGRHQNGARFYMHLSPRGDLGGDFAQRAQVGMVAGKFTLEYNLFCTQSAATLLGRKFCSPVYRNSGGSAETQSEFVYPDSNSVRYFSVAQ
jgi:hypothetical protein